MKNTTTDPSGALPYWTFWMAGFEGADHVNGRGEPLDLVGATGHDSRVDADYAALRRLGIRTVRESIGWRLTARGRRRGREVFDFSRALRFAEAARRQGVQVLWSLMHYGMPGDVSVLDDSFCGRFAEFAAAAAQALRPWSEAAPVYTPINEINFLAWAVTAGETMHPYRRDSLAHARARAARVDLGFDVKCRLVRATLAAIAAIRSEDVRSRFLHIEPLTHVAPPPAEAHRVDEAAAVSAWQWQAWDMIAGRLLPELGGSPSALDLLGVNYYHSCQWELGSERRLEWHLRDPRRVPFASLLRKAWTRYRKPLVVAETSHVGEGRAEWIAEIAAEVGRARACGTPVQGICLYPIVDRPDWNETQRWHQSGLWQVAPASDLEPGRRILERRYAHALRRAQRTLPPGAASNSTSTSLEPRSAMPHLVVFSHLRWNFVYQRPQHLLSRLARRYPVVFIEEPVRSEAPAWLERTSPAPGVEVLRPHSPASGQGFHDDQLSTLEPLIGAWLQDEGVDDYVAWLYTPMALPLLNQLTPRAVVYDCMDELAAFKNAPRQMRQRESALLKTADLVLTGGPSLYEAKRALNANVLCLPSAVDAAHYAAQRAGVEVAAMARAEELQGSLPRPRLGFFGVIDERLDLQLLAQIADAQPDWQVVMVGPVAKIDPASLPLRANLHWLGQQPYDLLPQLVAGWDVCLMPFAMNESTRFISPTKTLEYMAAGKPVVSTPIHDVSTLFGDLVLIEGSAASFIAACGRALMEDDEARGRRQAAMADRIARYSWDDAAMRIVVALGRLTAEIGQMPQAASESKEAVRPRAAASGQR